MPLYLEQSLAKLEEFEGCIQWMYQDTVGKVTTGVGLMLPDAAAACRLPFQLGERPATEAEIAAEFARVQALPRGKPALSYRAAAGNETPELTQSEIEALLRNVLVGFEAHLRGRLAGYETLPDPAKLALLDMAYNLGPERLLREYPHLLAAVAAGAWSAAAEACLRHGPAPARNAWTRQQFLSLAQTVGSIRAEAERSLSDLAYGLLGLAAALGSALMRWVKARPSPEGASSAK